VSKTFFTTIDGFDLCASRASMETFVFNTGHGPLYIDFSLLVKCRTLSQTWSREVDQRPLPVNKSRPKSKTQKSDAKKSITRCRLKPHISPNADHSKAAPSIG